MDSDPRGRVIEIEVSGVRLRVDEDVGAHALAGIVSALRRAP
jgi:hypothetical protein